MIMKEAVMGLFSKALAVGFGYVLAQPAVRQKLVELAEHPRVKQRRDQVQDLATNGLQATKRRLSRSSASDTTDADGSAPIPPHTGVPTPSPFPRASDRAALSESVVPPAEAPSTATRTTAPKDS
jgi:hypothetical protein